MKQAIIVAQSNFEKCRGFAELEDYTPIKEFNNFDDGYKFAVENGIKVIFINSLAELGNDANEVASKFSKLTDEAFAVYSFTEKLDTTTAQGKYVSLFISALNQIGK